MGAVDWVAGLKADDRRPAAALEELAGLRRVAVISRKLGLEGPLENPNLSTDVHIARAL